MIIISEINITSLIVYAINNMISNLLSSINSNLFNYLDDLFFINEDITQNISMLLGISPNSGINLICNSLIYGFLLYYAFFYLLSRITFSQFENPSQFIFKLLLCTFALNSSEILCTSFISFCNSISNAILELGADFFGAPISFGDLIENIIPSEYFASSSFSLFGFDGILKATITFGFLSLSVTYSIRYILIKVFILISPFAILSLASSKTSFFFKSWIKNFISLMFLQILVSLILLVCFAINTSNFVLFPKQILHLGMIYSLFKANSFVRDLIGGLSTDVSLSIPNISSIFNGGGSK